MRARGGPTPDASALAANPLREQPFLAGFGRQPRMQGLAVERARRLDIAEEERIALLSAMPDAEQRKFGLRAVEIVVEIYKERGDTLAAPGDFFGVAWYRRIEEIEMPVELLTHLVVQHVGVFQRAGGKARSRRDARAHQLKHKIGGKNVELGGAVGARRIDRGLARGAIKNARGPKPRTRARGDPVADFRRQKILDCCNVRRPGQNAERRRLEPA